MEASQIMHRCILSALLFFAITWLCLVLHKFVHTARATRWKFRLLLSSCALTCVCDLVLFVLNELQLREDGTHGSPQLCFAAEGLIQVRKRVLSPRHWRSTSLLLTVYDQLSGTLTVSEFLRIGADY